MMRIYCQVKGVKQVTNNLNKQIKSIENRTMAGLLEAAAFIQKDMDKTYPKVPVDTRNLQHSWFVTRFGSKRKPKVLIGFSANYAAAVHEKVEKSINWKRPGSGPKFLEQALKRNKKKILEIIANNTKIK